MMPLPPPLAIVILTAVFITSTVLLHTIFRALPGISWWWKTIIALKKSIKLDEVGKPVSVAFANTKRRFDNNRQEDDIELGSLPI
ncbi:hypothetical protein F5882DRAFT_17452 [Hyaloscypha sp. PMI_1271]|nr:hypothetical protein F5882DRAFT_17452 [Hyaloscypha sp. PMI_1271]